ncbi:MAG: hypothetical protein A2283_21920 [Lentisphaerae bacterium RIFOXYA12_FULL_48_11]|nr:MAG: hypothetical protein A2283_21920 [Lentisphaerae bacterium RIFOXYA12_FULL_48_11]
MLSLSVSLKSTNGVSKIDYCGYTELLPSDSDEMYKMVTCWIVYCSISQEESDLLFPAMENIGLWTLVDDKEVSHTGFWTEIKAQKGNFTTDLRSSTLPTNTIRAALHKAVYRYVKFIWKAHPEARHDSTVLCEKDNVKARAVDFRELVSRPETYMGKRVSVIGYYNEKQGRRSLYLPSVNLKPICISGESEIASREDVKWIEEGWVIVEGLLWGGRDPDGEFGAGKHNNYAAELLNVTRFKPLSLPASNP